MTNIAEPQISTVVLEEGERHWERFNDRHPHFETDSASSATLITAMGLSDFVALILARHPDLVQELTNSQDLKEFHGKYKTRLQAQLKGIEEEASFLECIRHFRNREMCRIAWLDIFNLQSIEDSLALVSELADALIICTYDWIYEKQCNRYGIPQGSKGPQPLLIIGMGKLGGKELNFSSDIDLIFAYPEPGEIDTGRKTIEHHTFFTKIAQKLINALHQTTMDGQVFRVDMRLRPFGDSGPIVTNLSSLEDYYQEQGREWERYAMVKGRILNPNNPYSSDLTEILRPFVFRRYIDFGVIDALRKMKQLIQQEVRRRKLNRNIKLGAGGIREVEFIVQSFQLIRGGREPQLQEKNLLKMLNELALVNALKPEAAAELKNAYLLLRKVEHCLQQFNDQQTQDLPTSELDQTRLENILAGCGHSDLASDLDNALATVSGYFAEIVGTSESEEEHQAIQELKDAWSIDLAEEELEALLKPHLPESECSEFCSALIEFKSEINKRPLGKRGAESLDKLMPWLMDDVIATAPESYHQTFSRILKVIGSVLTRTAYLELLLENEGASRQLVKLCAASPWITEQISRFPILLDELLNPAELYNPPALDSYSDALRQTMLRIPDDDLEQQMESLRQYKLSQQLRIAASDVTGALPVMKVSDHLSALAESVIEEVVQTAWQQMTDKYGYPSGADDQDKHFAVIAYGKLGGLELGYGSDLDMVFLHDCSTDKETTGPKHIESKQFYTKLAQRILHLFTTKTASGDLYEVDMRLRPSGNSGLLVSHIKAFEDYQLNEAWTWEHQALVRSRCVMGDDHLKQNFEAIRKQILCLERETPGLQKDIVEMRVKMRDHLNKGSDSQFDLKQDVGGIADIEFMVQYWVLNHAKTHPELSVWSDNVRILESLLVAKIISEDQEQALKEAYLEYRHANHLFALQNISGLDSSGRFASKREEVSQVWKKTFQNLENL